MALAFTTELDGVNGVLALVGETPVNNLEDSGVTEANTAREILHRVSKNVQSIGLESNTETNYKLIRNINNEIVLPLNVLRVDAVDKFINVVQRGQRLYDKENHTYIFDKDVEVDIVFCLDFEELTEVVRTYIVIKAAREYQRRYLSSEVLEKLTEREESEAWLNLFDAEIFSGDYSILDSPDVSNIVRR